MATVRKRRWGDGKWAWEVAYSDEDGRRRREKCCSKRAAEHRRRTIEHDVEMGAHIAKRATVTLEEAANAWLPRTPRPLRPIKPQICAIAQGGPTNPCAKYVPRGKAIHDD